jgi:AraC-like DNA-binding protein
LSNTSASQYITNTSEPNVDIASSFEKKLMSVIYDNLSDKSMDVKVMCHKLEISRANLHRKVKSIYGKSITHVINDIKLERSIDLLKEGLKVNEVADFIGYRDPKYFSKLFSKRYGVKPSMYCR